MTPPEQWPDFDDKDTALLNSVLASLFQGEWGQLTGTLATTDVSDTHEGRRRQYHNIKNRFVLVICAWYRLSA